MLVQQGVAHLDDAENDDEEQRQDDRELDDALAALAARVRNGAHGNLASFFIVDDTMKWILPPVKNGRMSGVMMSQS